MSRWSFAQRLALILFLVLALIVTTFGAAAYGEVRDMSVTRGAERLRNVARELVTSSARTTSARLSSGMELTAHPLVQAALLDNRTVEPGSLAWRALDSLARVRRPTDTTIVQRELWSRQGVRIWSSGSATARDSLEVLAIRQRVSATDSAAVSALYVVDGRGRLLYGIPARRARSQVVGTYVEILSLRGNPQAEQVVSSLIGDRVRVAYVNHGGDLWLDHLGRPMARPVKEIDFESRVDSLAGAVTLQDGGSAYLAAAAVAGTPVRIALLQQEETLLTRPRALRFKFVLIAVVLVLAGTLVVWWVSQHAQAALESQNRKLHEANAAKARFLGVMSHELRTPLNAIAGHAELIALGVHGAVTPAQEQALVRIQRNKDQLLHLVNDILFFTRLDSQPLEVARERVSLQEQFETLESNLRFEFARKGVRFEVVDTDLVLLADSVRLQQVLVNLVTNAWRFTEGGGRVTVSATADGGQARIEVRDTGVGIASDDLALIFEPFVQADTSLTRRSGGAGLGLAIVRTLIEAMGGSVAVQSTRGTGTVFTCRLPIAPPESDGTPALTAVSDETPVVTAMPPQPR